MANPLSPVASTQKSGTVHNAVVLDAKTPIPIETGGIGFTTKAGRRYVPFFDNGDNFFQIMLEAMLLSPTNLACVNSKTKFSIGRGLMLMDAEDKELNEWAKKINKRCDTLNDVLRKTYNGYWGAGNVFIEVIRTRVGSTPYVKVYARNHVDCRLKTPENDDIATHVIVSKEFRRKGIWNLKDEDGIEIPIYNGESSQKWYKSDQGEHIMIHLKHEVSGYDYYGMPSNIACLPQQILEYKMARHNLDDFDNNLQIGGVIAIEGNMSPDEAKKLGKNIIMQHSGDGKRGRYIILSSENGISNTKIIPFDKSKDYDFINGSKRIEEQIFLSNEWSKALIDPQSGGIGNSGKQIRELYETKMNTVIGPVQQLVIEKVLTPIMGICSDHMKKKWADYEFAMNNIPVLGIGNDIDANAVLSINEGRQAIGYEETDQLDGNTRIKTSTKAKDVSDK